MKVLIVSAIESKGGAARAAHRLYDGLLGHGVDVTYLTNFRSSTNSEIISLWPYFTNVVALFFTLLDKLPLLLYPQRQRTIFSPAVVPTQINSLINTIGPDIVHLHWIAHGSISIEQIAKIRKPILWTLHDSWAFTGGCHLPFDCKRYQSACGSCPQLGSSYSGDLSNRIWKRKEKAFKELNIQVVAPSQWLAGCARLSSLFKDFDVTVIPNGIDTKLYQPTDISLARAKLNLPQNKKLVLFGAMGLSKDANKGLQFLKPVLKNLAKQKIEDLEFVIMGSRKSGRDLDFGFPIHYLGTVRSEPAIVSLYGAVDVTLLLSLQENLPFVVMESLSCGTPVVAFKIGGVPDMVDHQVNGYLAKPYEVEDIARGIAWVLEDKARQVRLREQARKKCEDHFSLELQARRYTKLYSQILSKQQLSAKESILGQ